MKRTVSDRLLPLLADGLTLALLLAGSLVSVQAGYDLSLPPGLLVFTGLALALGALLLFHLPRFQPLAVVLVLAAWGFWLWQGWEGLSQGGIALLEAILAQLTGGTGQVAADAVSIGSALLVASIPWGLLAGWSLLRARSAGLTLVLAWLPLIPAFCVDGGVCWPALLLLGAASLSCLLSARPVGEDALARGARWRFLSLAVSALLLLGLTWLSPAGEYTYPQWADSARLWLDGYTEGFPILGPGENGILQPTPSAGLSAEVDLTQAHSPQYTGSPVLRVESSWTGNLYLRGYSLGTNTGERWEPVQESAYDERLDGSADSYRQLLEQWPVLCYPAAVQRNTAETVTVVDLGTPSDWVYVPYQINSLSGLEPVLDSSLSRSDGLWQHSFSFVPPDLDELTALSGDWGAAETFYDQFVRENYLQLPEGMEERLAPYVEQVLGGADPETVGAVELARQVAQLLDGLAEYDLSTPAPPAGEDFTLWFLEESHRGYCVHFATAGALLLRAMDIPARYTAGYALPVTAGETTEVPDSAAHAWVEIYLSGYGWYPVEMTPGGGDQLPAENLQQSQQPPEQQPETPDPSPEPSETPDQPEQPPAAPSEPEAPAQPESGPEAEPETPGNSLFGAVLSALTALLTAAVCLAGLAFALWGGRTLWLRHWERKMLQPDVNRAVLEIYGRFQALRRWGGEIPEEITALGKKAKFSQHRLTEQERQQARALLTKELRQVGRALPPWKRWLFWMVWDR